MTDVHVVPSALLQKVGTVPFDPNQVQVVTYNDHARAVCELEDRADRAYNQRNNAAVALVRMALLLGWPAGRGLDNKTENDLAWRHVVYIDLPGGEQVSYHMAPGNVPLLEGLPAYSGEWDGEFTGMTAWANLVPAMPGDVPLLQALENEPTEVWPTSLFSVRAFTPSELADAQEFAVYHGARTGRVPKEPFKPGVCACPKCEQPRAVGKLFCALHRSVDSRLHGSIAYLTNEQLAYMMQRDGEQQ